MENERLTYLRKIANIRNEINSILHVLETDIISADPQELCKCGFEKKCGDIVSSALKCVPATQALDIID